MFTTSAAPSGPGRGTALMRALSLLFAGAVAFATLYPLVDWRLRAQGAFAFLLEGLPRYWTWFDVLSNAFAYGVLGLLLTLGWLTRATPPAAFASVTLACSLMSLGLEAAQTYLPARVPSLLDWIANTLGGAAGAWLGATLNRAAQRSERLAVPVRELWYEQGPPTGWVLLLLWLAAQLVPQRLLFATGHVEPALQRMLDRLQPADRPDLSRLVGWLWGEAAPTGYGVAIEAGVVVCAVCTVGAIAFALVQGSRRRLALIAGIALFAFGLRSLAHARRTGGPGGGRGAALRARDAGPQAARGRRRRDRGGRGRARQPRARRPVLRLDGRDGAGRAAVQPARAAAHRVVRLAAAGDRLVLAPHRARGVAIAIIAP
jgi:VanZ family protein